MALTIKRPGMLALIQDQGRRGFQQFGISSSGAMDKRSARLANILIGNDSSAPVLELTLSGAEFFINETILIAICGADMEPVLCRDVQDSIRTLPLPMNRPLLICEGTMIRLNRIKEGCRVYLAIEGGIAAREQLGSCSTDVRAGLGGIDGTALQHNDVIKRVAPISSPDTDTRVNNQQSFKKRLKEELERGPASNKQQAAYAATSWFVDVHRLFGDHRREDGEETYNKSSFNSKDLQAIRTIRIVQGAQFDRLTSESQQLLLTSYFQVSPQSDRMGYRLQGAELKLKTDEELLSEAVEMGTVQLPANGQPIILMADRQTIGGYAKIAQICSVDLPLLAQMRPGELLAFTVISQQEAEMLLIQEELGFEQLRTAIDLRINMKHAE